jgi:hypothetical protein
MTEFKIKFVGKGKEELSQEFEFDFHPSKIF